jgi:hypothetical protein
MTGGKRAYSGHWQRPCVTCRYSASFRKDLHRPSYWDCRESQQQTERPWETAEHCTLSGWKTFQAAWQSSGSLGVGRRHCTVNRQDYWDTHSCRRTWLTTGCHKMLVHSWQGWAGVGTAWVRARVGRQIWGRGLVGASSQICSAGADETKVCSRQVDR